MFSILGPLSVRRDDGSEVTIRGAKQRALLVRLLLDANRAVPSERLIEDLWEGSPPRSAAGTLQSHVSHLRRLLGPDRITTHAGGYAVVVGEEELDAEQFRVEVDEGGRLLGAGDAPAAAVVLRAALGRVRGEILADAAGAAWSQADAARLDALHQQATETLVESLLAAGEPADAVATAEGAVAARPLRERMWALLMTALYRAGRQADALRAYQRVRTTLADELGIEPSHELRVLEASILAQDPALTAVAPVTPSPPPSGVVTFLLTDIEGSTRLWETAPADMAAALGRHDATVGRIVDLHGGLLLKPRGEGDSTFSVFRRATDAVAAARTVLLALTAETWPAAVPLRVRIALHTGEAHERDGDYFGPAVNRAARLRGLADGGQVLLSQATTELVIDQLPEGCALLPRGTHDLAGLSRPETVYELVVGGAATPLPAAAPGGAPLPARLARPPVAGFHGRAAEMAILSKAYARAEGGERRVALVAGEAGIGKTALAGEAARLAFGRGATVLYGRCEEEVGGPYRPWAEALGQLLAHLPDGARARVGPARLGHLAPLVPQILSAGTISPAAPGDPERDRWLAFEAAAAVLEAAALDGPVVLVLEDLHWSDAGTIFLLRHVVDALDGARVLVLALYRDTDIGPDHPLHGVLAALHRLAGIDRIRLAGLTGEEHTGLMEALAGQRLTGSELELTHAVHRETGGNPFFSWEIMLHLVESGAFARDATGRWLSPDEVVAVDLPASVREVVARRVARVGEETVRVLSTAAVIGREFDFDVLRAASAVADDVLIDLLDAAERAGLVAGVAAGRFVFGHALIADSLAADLSPTRKARIHLAVAQAMEELGVGRPAELARHWAATGRAEDLATAIDHARRAGDEARAALSPHEAVRWYATAVELASRTSSVDEHLRCDLLVRLGRSQRDAGDPGYRETLLDAARLARRIGAVEQLVRAALANNRGYTSLIGFVDAERVEMLEAALTAVGGGDTPVRARLLAVLGAELSYAGDARRCRAAAEEAVAMARRLGDDRTLAQALNLAFIPSWAPDALELRRDRSREAMLLAETLDDPALAHWAGTWCVMAALEAGDVDDAADHLDRLKELAASIGLPSVRWTNVAFRAVLALLHGDVERAEMLTDEMQGLLDEASMPEASTLVGPLRGGILEHVGRTAEFDGWRIFVASSLHQLVWSMRVRLARGDRDGAAELAPAAMAAVVARTEPAWWVTAADLALLSVELGDARSAAALYEELLPWSGRPVFIGTSLRGSIAHALAVVAAFIGREADVEAHFAQADEVNARLRAPFFQARTWLEWGRYLGRRQGPGDTERSLELLRRAQETAAAFGCAGIEREAAGLLASPPPPWP